MRFLLVIALALFASSISAAQSQTTDIRPDAKRITGDALLAEFLGVTHDGAYNFSEEGEAGRYYVETHHDDSRTSYVEDGNTTIGVWSIRQNFLCFQYPGEGMNGGCFRVYKVGNCFYYYSNQLPERRLEIDQPYWTARSVKQGEAPNCDPVVS